MAKLGFLLSSGPYRRQNLETVAGIAEAALRKGHEVSIFIDLDGVYAPVRHQYFLDLPALPRELFESLVRKGAQIVVCGVCLGARGLESARDLIEGVRVGAVPDFSEILGKVDRLIAL
jgi:tRNA 2-thiouridine synthesizing protein D